MEKNEFDDVKEVLDNMVIQTAINTIKQQTLISMVLGVYHQTLPEEIAKQISLNFANMLEQNLLESLDELKDGLFDDGNLLLRNKLAVKEQIDSLRSNFG